MSYQLLTRLAEKFQVVSPVNTVGWKVSSCIGCKHGWLESFKLYQLLPLLAAKFHVILAVTPVEEKRLTLVWRSHSPFKTHQRFI